MPGGLQRGRRCQCGGPLELLGNFGLLADNAPSLVLPLQILAWPLAVFLSITVLVDIYIYTQQTRSVLPPPEFEGDSKEWNKRSSQALLLALSIYSWAARVAPVDSPSHVLDKNRPAAAS